MKKIYILVIGIFLIASCSKSSIEQEQDLCKDAKSVPQITFVKLSNTYALKKNILDNFYKQDSISVTFTYQDTEADIGTNFSQTIVNSDGSRFSGYVDIYKKNADLTFTKLVTKESYNFFLSPVNTKSSLEINASNYLVRITSLSSCSGEITYSMLFDLALLEYVGGLKLNDKVKFQLYIRDRVGHTSNIIETSETTLSENP
ncbi:MAG: hypothetical protein U5N85_18695 [Arcicella sp.]|nr:hypothetical protein [Arcicella sp.]